MTEKRYGMSNETGAFIDKQINKEYTDDEIIDLLNSFNDENEQLKQELEDLKFTHRTEMALHRVIEKELEDKIEKMLLHNGGGR